MASPPALVGGCSLTSPSLCPPFPSCHPQLAFARHGPNMPRRYSNIPRKCPLWDPISSKSRMRTRLGHNDDPTAFGPLTRRHRGFGLPLGSLVHKTLGGSRRYAQVPGEGEGPDTSRFQVMLSSFLGPIFKNLEEADIGILPTSAYLAQAALIGLLTGLSIITFKTLISFMETYTYGNFLTSALNAFGSGRPLSLAMAAIPALGGVIVACIRELAQEFPPGLSGQIDDVEKQRPLDLKRAVGKTLSAVATLGSGCSLGPEGPAVEIGATCSRVVSSGGTVDQRLKLLAAGAAAGVAAGFNAPIAGVFFALEIAQGSSGNNVMQKSTLAAILLSAVIAALVARVGLNEELALRPAPYQLQNPLVELPAYLGLGILSGVVALTFKYMLARSDEFFKGKLQHPLLPKQVNFMAKVPRFFKPIIGGAVCGLTGIIYPPILFFGYETLDGLIANQSYEAPLLVTLLLLKGVMTALCLGSGLVGGLFAPSLFLGATAGAAYQKLVAAVLATSLSIAGPPAYAMVGAASVLASMFRAPLTASLLLFELTRDYDILLPLMASAGMGSLLVELVERKKMANVAAAAAAAVSAAKDDVTAALQKGSEASDDPVRDAIIKAAANEQALPESGSLRLTTAGRGGLSDVYLYELTSGEALMRDALTLPGSMALEAALVECCKSHARAVMVVEEGEGGQRRLIGAASLRDLTTAIERWFEEAARKGKSITPNPAVTTDATMSDGVWGQDEALGQLLTRLPGVTGVTLAQACVPFRADVAAYVGGSDRLVKARDVLSTRSLVLLPVLSDDSGLDPEKAEPLGLLDWESIDSAVRLREAVDIVSSFKLKMDPSTVV